jgi:hypothetical protein
VGQLDGIADSGDPWSAWAEDESSGPEFAPTVEPPPEVEAPPVVTQASEPLVAAVAAPVLTVEPVEEPSQPVEAPAEDDEDLVTTAGEVIAFPTERVDFPRRRTHGANALAEKPVAPSATAPASRGPRVRLSIVLGTSIVASSGSAGGSGTSGTRPARCPCLQRLLSAARGAQSGGARTAAVARPAQLRIVEQELVDRLPQTTRPVRGRVRSRDGAEHGAWPRSAST